MARYRLAPLSQQVSRGAERLMAEELSRQVTAHLPCGGSSVAVERRSEKSREERRGGGSMVVGRRGGIQVRESRWSGILGSSPRPFDATVRRDRSTRHDQPPCIPFHLSARFLLLRHRLSLSFLSPVHREPKVRVRGAFRGDRRDADRRSGEDSTLPADLGRNDSTHSQRDEHACVSGPRDSAPLTDAISSLLFQKNPEKNTKTMKLSTALAFLCLLGSAVAALNPEGTKCGEKRCSTVEYCSPYDKHCKPCSNICDATGRNYQPNECVSDCQEYLHDKRYVLLKQYEDLKGEIGRLWILAAASIAIAFFSLLSTFYLVARKFPRWEKMRNAVSRTFTGRRLRRTSHGNATSKSNNHHNNNNNNKSTQQDAELGTSKQNGLKIPMPTISATVAPSRCAEKDAGHGNGNCSASGSGSGSGSGIGISTVSGSGSGLGNATPNTTSTTLSRRHPSEDTTLDYAYDNPAMTPSPESVQLRTKRESSF